MKLQVYSIYDLKTQVFFPPMLFHNEGHARRDILSEIKKGGGMMREYPADFELWRVGDWQDDTGQVEAITPGIRVCRIDELLPKDAAVEGTRMLPFPGHSAPPTQV